MTEGFRVDEDHVAGFSVMTDKISVQTASIMGHVKHEASATSGYTGLMSLAKTAVDGYAHAASLRFANRVDLLNGMATELNRAAWAYSGADESSYEKMHPIMPGQTVGYKDYPSPASYSAGTEPELKAPAHTEADIRGQLDDVGGAVNTIDDVVSVVTGWSPVSTLISPLSGNWTELERAGKVLRQSGDAAETVSSNLTSQLGKLDSHWDGGAAISFESYATKVGKAIDIEGPLNRLVGWVYIQASEVFAEAAKFMCEQLNTAVKKITTTIATGWVPALGWYKVYDTVKTVVHIFNQAKKMVEEVQRVVETLKTVVNAAKDPVEFMKSKIEDELKPIKDAIDQTEEVIDVGGDVIELGAGADDMENVPTDDYTVGSDPERDGA